MPERIAGHFDLDTFIDSSNAVMQAAAEATER
jgi:hypothetical protein